MPSRRYDQPGPAQQLDGEEVARGGRGKVGFDERRPTSAAAFDLAGFRAHLASHLPDYARPLFVRFQNHLDLTGTFKQRKVELVKEGFDPSAVKDAIYYSDPAAQAFVRLDAAGYAAIAGGAGKM